MRHFREYGEYATALGCSVLKRPTQSFGFGQPVHESFGFSGDADAKYVTPVVRPMALKAGERRFFTRRIFYIIYKVYSI